MNLWEFTEGLPDVRDREAAERAMCDGVKDWALGRIASLYPTLREYEDKAEQYPHPYGKLAEETLYDIRELEALIKNTDARKDVLYCQLRDRMRK